MSAPETFRAQMATRGGHWRLYVVLLNTWDQWPGMEWSRTAPVPTLAERERALAGLGYEIAPGAEWEWCEDTETPEDSASPVLLIAAATVQCVGEVA